MANQGRFQNRASRRASLQERREIKQERRAARNSGPRTPRTDATEADRVVIVKPKIENVAPKNLAQKQYLAAMKSSEVVFGEGPAGTGKTFLAVTEAAFLLKEGIIDKIIVTRPTVNVENEEMGFLPGELADKNGPYFRPVRDVFEKVFGTTHLEYLLRAGKIEATPMAFMRGWSVNAFIIADEMQNATLGQFRMLLTRSEEGSRYVLNGDSQQTDLAPGKSGFKEVMEKLKNVEGVTVVKFTDNDIVRSGLTQRIVRALS